MTEREDAEPVEDSPTVGMPALDDDSEPAVEGVAVELADESPTPEPEPRPEPASPAVEVPAVTPPAAPGVPVAVQAPSYKAAPPPAANPIVDVSAAPSATPSFDGHAHEPPMNPVGEIAATRPELLVGAAFAGGILAAMILRRLGN